MTKAKASSEISVEQVEGIMSKMRELPAPDRSKRLVSKQEAVRMMAKEIAAMQKRGYTLEEIAEVLKGEGLAIKPTTLKQYMQKSRKAKNGASSPAKASAANKASAEETAAS